ncbi:pyridoxal-phosphate-dependent aminotransferase family protein [Pseudoroseomonas cervicalis]|uniref:Aminotransferase, class V n=1 Tax=Pseudoroseomonas cervicalis ATCC 49957 TaxID=525371 RepID=D5RJA6_9PROT|nr:aminotransferase class V-fold PLP-dependent enzyme [Pseudoroseomonas cervicalis]EFH12604.1 aminotransferase, class V [Pseudoroseomonas cervicalis ATCC 49957]
MAYFQSKPTAGRHFLQIPGPTNVPDKVLRALDNPTMDHRGPDFGLLGAQILEKVKAVFKTTQPVIIYPASGTGAWEAALVNTLSPGDTVLMCETGQFAFLWREMAERLGLKPELIQTDWRRAVDVPGIAAKLRADTGHAIKAVCVVHNETSTGCTSRIDEVRAALDEAGHPALLLVDTISSLGSIDYRHDEWGVDVTIAGSQKGLMLPPGLSFNAISPKALKASESAKLPRSFWDWKPMLASNATGYFPYTPATNMLYALDTALDLLLAEGLENVFARHDRHAEATRRAVRAWGLEVQCEDPRHYSSALTAVRLPEGHSANALRAAILAKFNMSLGNGLGRLNDRVFRIGHLGDFNDLALMGTLSGVEMGLRIAGVPHQPGGVKAAMDYLSGNS